MNVHRGKRCNLKSMHMEGNLKRYFPSLIFQEIQIIRRNELPLSILEEDLPKKKKKKGLRRKENIKCWQRRETMECCSLCLVGMFNSIIVKPVWQFFKKINIKITMYSSNSTSGVDIQISGQHGLENISEHTLSWQKHS